MFSVKAQVSYHDLLAFGKYKVNYCDTIIYDDEINYDQYGYSGSAPLFAQIWFPSFYESPHDVLTIGDYEADHVPSELQEVYEKLGVHMDEILIRDGIEFDLNTDELIDYGDLTYEEILDKIKRIPTRSRRSDMKEKSAFPAIVYHHGSQGLSWENSVMGEYFASNGYVFISANFHLPYENTIYGLLPYHLEKENTHNQSSAKALINFAKSITSLNRVYFIGHSWGAQEGWCFLHDSTLVDGFVSMETTIEYKSDTTKIKEFWPYVYNALKKEKNTFSIPILLFAAADDYTNFEFFKGVSTEEMVFASYKAPFAHNSYTSAYMMRYFLSPEISQPDSGLMRSQIMGYADHTKLILAFFESIRKNQQVDRTLFEKEFSFHE